MVLFLADGVCVKIPPLPPDVGKMASFLLSSFFGQRATEVLKSSPLTVVQVVVAATRIIALKSSIQQRLVLWIIN